MMVNLIGNIKVFLLYTFLISFCCNINAYKITTEDLKDLSAQYDKRSEQTQNFLTRPRPGKREIFKDGFRYADLNMIDDLSRDTNEIEDLRAQHNKRSEQTQNFLTRPRPGKREIFKDGFRYADLNMIDDPSRDTNEIEDLSAQHNKRSEQTQNFLTRPRPGKREIFKDGFGYADLNMIEDPSRDTNEIEDLRAQHNKRSEQTQNFLTRPRPGKREIFKDGFGYADLNMIDDPSRDTNEIEDLSAQHNKRSEQTQNFLTRPRPGKREVFKDGFGYADLNMIEDPSRDTNEIEDLRAQHNKRSEQTQNFLTRPRPGKREIFKDGFGYADLNMIEDPSRDTNEIEDLRAQHNKRSEQTQNFLTRPRPGKRENFVKNNENDKTNENSDDLLRELEIDTIKDLVEGLENELVNP